MEEYSDKELLEKFSNEATRSYAFNLLVKKYQRRLYAHIRRMLIDHEDSNDVLQNVLLKMWQNLHSFKADSQLFTWLYRVATNECLTFLKKKRTKYFLPLVDVEHQLSKSLEDDNYFNGDEIQLKLQKAILTLPEKQRLVFNMKYYEDFKYEDMSQVLGTSVGALKASYHIAVKKIEEFVLKN